MTTIHPNDNEIQEYSLNNNFDPIIAEHINHCEQCSIKAGQYKVMFRRIKQQGAPGFDFDLTALVMEQLPVKKAKKSTDKYFIYSGVSAAVCMLAVLVYVVKKYLPNIVNGLTPLLIFLIVITALIISLFLSVDMYKKFKVKMDALNFS